MTAPKTMTVIEQMELVRGNQTNVADSRRMRDAVAAVKALVEAAQEGHENLVWAQNAARNGSDHVGLDWKRQRAALERMRAALRPFLPTETEAGDGDL